MLVQVAHILPLTVVQRSRELPLPGEVLVRAGQKVRASDVIGRAVTTPQHLVLNVAKALGVSDLREVRQYIEREVDENVEEGDILASRSGLGKRVFRAPVAGTIKLIWRGNVLLRVKSDPYELRAGLPGMVTSLIPDMGAVIQSIGALVQGMWGNGKVDFGLMNVLAQSADHVLTTDQIDVSMRGSVVLAGHCESESVLRYTAEQRLRGLILSSMPPELERIALELPFPVVLTEGFGERNMNTAAFQLLSTNDKRDIALNAEPFNRAKGTRPELLIPLPGTNNMEPPPEMETPLPGQRVRLLRNPYLGYIGTIDTVIPGMTRLPSGLRVQVANIRLENNELLKVPLTNFEILK